MNPIPHILVIGEASPNADSVRRQLREQAGDVRVTTTAGVSEATVVLRLGDFAAIVWCVSPDDNDHEYQLQSLSDMVRYAPVIMVTDDREMLVDEIRDIANADICGADDVAAHLQSTLKASSKTSNGKKLRLKRRDDSRVDMVRITAGTLYHEVSNPIMTILGMAELILDEDEALDPGVKDKIEAIQTSAGRIQATLNRLMQLEEPQLRDTASGHIIDHISSSIGSNPDD